MRLEIEHAGDRTQVELRDGIFSFGGAAHDAIRLPGLDANAFAVLIDGPQVVVESEEALSFDGVLAPPRVRRLWLAGERLMLNPSLSLHRLPEASEGGRSDATRAVVHDLFDGGEAAGPTTPRFLCLTGLDLGRQFPLVEGITEVGRGEAAGLRIRDRAVSRRHARVVHEAGRTVIEDLGTSNGIYVCGHRARGRTELYDGDVVEIGRALLKFLGGAPRPAPELPPAAPSEPVQGAAPSRAKAVEWLLTAGAVVMALAGAIATWRITG